MSVDCAATWIYFDTNRDKWLTENKLKHIQSAQFA